MSSLFVLFLFAVCVYLFWETHLIISLKSQKGDKNSRDLTTASHAINHTTDTEQQSPRPPDPDL